MKKKIYVFGFDNTLVNSEDLIVELTSQILGIDMSKEFWYTNLHSVTDIETEMQILEDAFHVSYTLELQQKPGELFMQELLMTAPFKPVYNLVKEHESTCHFLTGSPLKILQEYFSAWNITIPEERLHCGIYNGSGDKEKVLANLQKDFDVIYIDDDVQLIKNARALVSDTFLVKQPYNKEFWSELKTLD